MNICYVMLHIVLRYWIDAQSSGVFKVFRKALFEYIDFNWKENRLRKIINKICDEYGVTFDEAVAQKATIKKMEKKKKIKSCISGTTSANFQLFSEKNLTAKKKSKKIV
eukprot:29721_1